MSNTDCISAHAGAHCAKEASAPREHAGPNDDAAAAETARTLNAILVEAQRQTQLLAIQTRVLTMRASDAWEKNRRDDPDQRFKRNPFEPILLGI